jgi:hypothetical protein
MHIDTIANRNSRPAYLLRESVRDGKHVRKRTLANLSSLPIEQIEAIRRILKGERLGPIEDGLEVVRSRAHGHVEAVTTAMQRLGFAKLIDARPSCERDLVVAMVAERILAPEASKLGMTRAWTDTTLGEDLGVADAHEDELYAAMDWLVDGRMQSRSAWPNATLRVAGSCCSTSPRAISRASPARLQRSATAATASAARCR